MSVGPDVNVEQIITTLKEFIKRVRGAWTVFDLKLEEIKVSDNRIYVRGTYSIPLVEKGSFDAVIALPDLTIVESKIRPSKWGL